MTKTSLNIITDKLNFKTVKNATDKGYIYFPIDNINKKYCFIEMDNNIYELVKKEQQEYNININNVNEILLKEIKPKKRKNNIISGIVYFNKDKIGMEYLFFETPY